MSARSDVVRGIYDAMLTGDAEPWLAAITDDFEWRWPPGMLEGTSAFRGREGVREGNRIWSEAWEQLAMEPQEVLERGDDVLAVVRYRARGRTSGLEIDETVAHLWRFRGEKIAEMRMSARVDRAKRRFFEQES